MAAAMAEIGAQGRGKRIMMIGQKRDSAGKAVAPDAGAGHPLARLGGTLGGKQRVHRRSSGAYLHHRPPLAFPKCAATV
jgi:hypothetical protein